MVLESVSLTSNDVASNTTTTTSTTSSDPAEHILGPDEYGNQASLTGNNMDIYRALSYMFNQKSNMYEHNLTPWLLDEKYGSMGGKAYVATQVQELTTILQNAGVSTLLKITAEEEDDGQFLLVFTFTNGEEYILDPFISAALKNAV